MECPKCHHDNRADAAFCSECAAPLPRTCPQCGRANPAGSKFCDGCAFDLTTGADDRPAEISTVSEGERRQATVLFSDLSGFTTMSEKLDPEEVLGLMRRLKDRAVEIVESHGGIVSQFVGDEVLALFGIPTAHEDDPVQAVREIHAVARSIAWSMNIGM